jgi:Calcineurin-like phosphoesterase
MRAERNRLMAERISGSPVRYPFSFVIAGDSGAWPDPTADAIFAQLLEQTARLRPAPLFFAHLGDFAGPGTRERHEHYLRLVEELPVPNVCIVGNHDLDDPSGADTWAQIHGPANFQFAYGHTRFVALDAASGRVGEIDVETPVAGPDEEALAFLADSLEAATEPHRIVLMHIPPRLDGRFSPHPEWGFEVREQAFLELLRRHEVELVCCAHALLFDHHVRDGTHFVVSGGGGTGLCSHFRGICTPGEGRPEDRGALFHAVEITVAEDGAISGRVLQAFDPVEGHARLRFGDRPLDA